MVEADLILEHAAELATPVGSAPATGALQGKLRTIADAALAVAAGNLVYVGPSGELGSRVRLRRGGSRLDVSGKTVLPGFVDPHTHLPFAGSRATEFEQRLAGRTYREIAEAGGGILSTVEQTRRADPAELRDAALRRLDRMLALGTTTCEAKSGYGLSLEAEIKQLRVLQSLAAEHPVEVVPTFLGAHTLPPERRAAREDYVREVAEEMIPRVAEEKLAGFCDVFCEQIAFTRAESETILRAGRKAGLVPRVHADQLSSMGAAELAAELGAASADHLEFVSEKGIEALARAGVTAVLLPGAAFFLMSPDRPPARRLIEAGVPVALATDLNPGTCMTESMPFVLTLACLTLKLSAAEAITAATLNAAHCLGRADRIGTLEVGKQADLQVLDIPGHHHLVYHFGVSHTDTVIKKGEIVYRKSPVRWAVS
ncbi:MAG TPA: imidazolonepropionase [Candidatus Polarisedimenticolia bacterium]|jgi:imidazolonepropionase|nr:imidazolonepropionase [Candidatus Polarisedimenticolia bacterium]